MKEELHRIESLGARGDVRELTVWLAHGDWQFRRAAIDAVVARARSSDADTRAAAVDELLRALHSEENAGLRNAAQEALGRIAPQVTGRLVREIEAAPEDVRILLAPVLGESGSAEAVSTLLDLARSEDVNIATSAIIGLGRLRRREAVAPLIGVLAGGNPWLAFPAVEALGTLGDASAVGPLASRLDDHLLGPTALEAVARVGGPEAARVLAARVFASKPLRAGTLQALVRVTQEGWPAALSAVVRADSVAALREQYRPEHFDELAELAESESPHAEAALEALGWSGDARALPILLAGLVRPASEATAAVALATLLEDSAIVAELWSHSGRMAPPVRLDLARSLASIAPVEVALLLAELIDDEEVGRDAADAVADVAGRFDLTAARDARMAREAVDRLLSAIERVEPDALPSVTGLVMRLVAIPGFDATDLLPRASGLFSAADADLRLAGFELFPAFGGAPSGDWRRSLTSAWETGDSAVRRRAVEALERVRDSELFDVFGRALADEDPLVRRAGATALGRTSGAPSSALRAAIGDSHSMVALAALGALAAFGGADGESALLEASRSERALLRCAAAERLAAMPSDAARARALQMAVEDPEFEVRRAALAALATAERASDARSAVEPALEAPHRAVRRAGLRLAAAIGDPALAGRVAAVADGDDPTDVRGEALVALAALAPESALERAGRWILDVGLAHAAVRTFERVAAENPTLLARYRDEAASPRAAFAIDALRAGRIR